MGIGRREFLKFASVALGGLAIDPLDVIAVRGDYYVNAKLGLGFIKPQGWAIEAFKDFAPDVEGQVIHGLPPDTDEKAFWREHVSTLVAIVCKYGQDERRFTPGITVFKYLDDDAVDESEELQEIALAGIEQYRGRVREFEVLDVPRRGTISGCPSVRFKARWLFEHREIKPVLIEHEALAIDQGSHCYSINLYDSPDTAEGAAEEFTCFLNSLHIA